MSVDFNIADVFKLPVKIFAAIALGAGLILFLPDSLIQKLYLVTFRDSFGFIIGLVFIISISIVGVTVLVAFYKMLSSKILFAKSKKSREKCLNGLDDYQKTIVYSLMEEINHTDELPIHDGSVIWLEQNWIIGKAASQHFISDPTNPTFPYMLQPWVVEYLNLHKVLYQSVKEAASKVEAEMKKQALRSGYSMYYNN